MWISALRGLKVAHNWQHHPSNRFILADFEQVQLNSMQRTQFCRTRNKNQDTYLELKVDNSESQGSLSERISVYHQQKTIFQ